MAERLLAAVDWAMRLLAVSAMLFIVGLASVGLGSLKLPPHLAPVCPQPQGNKVSLPDPPLRCVKTRKGWVCFEGGRDV